jgi:hypothetical protein
MYQCRSGRVRRQGLEPRTRGLREGELQLELQLEVIHHALGGRRYIRWSGTTGYAESNVGGSRQNVLVTMETATVERLRAALSRVDTKAQYYALTLTANEQGKIIWSSQSHWVGEGAKATWELRAPSLVHPKNMLAMWRTIREPGIVVNDIETFGIFLRVGGHALIEQTLAQRWLPHVLEPIECAAGPLIGLRPIHTVPTASLAHAPSKKLRMDVLRRDEFRCRICGRRAADHVDIELHVHHIRPHGMGGLTEADNLITLCHTCHTGLDPHLELSLFSMMPGGPPLGDIQGEHDRYTEGVRLYRLISARVVAQAAKNGARDR